MHRLFVAIRPPRDIRRQLLGTMHGIDQARWQDDAQLHLTLRFIGEVDGHLANDIAAHLGRVAFTSFPVRLAGMGRFDDRGRVNAVWMGATPIGPLDQLHRQVDRRCVEAGLPPDRRAFLPHVTLARLNRQSGPIEHFIADNAAFESTSFPVENIGLYESILGRDGAIYQLIERYPARLTAPPPDRPRTG